MAITVATRRNRRRFRIEKNPSIDPRTRKTVIYTTIFLLCGMLIAGELNAWYGKAPQEKTEQSTVSEAAKKEFLAELKFLNPNYSGLDKESLEMGKRICDKFKQNWSATRILGYISQPTATQSDPNPPSPSPAEMRFWIGFERAAVRHLCPQFQEKIAGWPENIDREIRDMSKVAA